MERIIHYLGKVSYQPNAKTNVYFYYLFAVRKKKKINLDFVLIVKHIPTRFLFFYFLIRRSQQIETGILLVHTFEYEYKNRFKYLRSDIEQRECDV